MAESTDQDTAVTEHFKGDMTLDAVFIIELGVRIRFWLILPIKNEQITYYSDVNVSLDAH